MDQDVPEPRRECLARSRGRAGQLRDQTQKFLPPDAVQFGNGRQTYIGNADNRARGKRSRESLQVSLHVVASDESAISDVAGVRARGGEIPPM